MTFDEWRAHIEGFARRTYSEDDFPSLFIQNPQGGHEMMVFPEWGDRDNFEGWMTQRTITAPAYIMWRRARLWAFTMPAWEAITKRCGPSKLTRASGS